MKTTINLILCIVVCLATATVSAEPFVEKGQASTTPWSGYWWPLHAGGLMEPLSKYDQATGRQAVAWEKTNRKINTELPKWFGFCHAWAASSIMEPEPQKPQRAANDNGRPVGLSVGDQKGLLAACHTTDVANSYGNRFGDDRDDDPQDIAPDVLWRVLKLYLGKQRVPLVLDIEAGPEVWNFPVYAYQIRLDGSDNGERRGALTLWMVDDGVPPDYVGSQVRRLSYTFTCTLRNGSVVLGSGRWTGRSQKDHPDFAWYPYLTRAENPEVVHQTVCAMVGQTSRPSAPSPATPPQPAASASSVVVSEPSQPGVIALLPGPDDPVERPVLTPVELAALVANRTSAFNLDVTIDRFDGGTYRPGEPISVHVRSQQSGCLYLFHLDSHGHLSLLYPTDGHPKHVASDTTIDIPGENDEFMFVAGNSPGLHRIKAVVTTRPIMLGGLVVSQQQSRQEQSLQPRQQVRPHQQQTQQPTAVRKKAVGIRSAVVEQVFRWPPAQQDQVQTILQSYVAQNAPQTVEDINVQKVIGQFAQDEVIFVVDAGEPLDKSRQHLQQTSQQSEYQQSLQQQIVEPQQ